MARRLTTGELGILGQHAAAGDRIAHYTALERFDNPYGTLALGVANKDAVADGGTH